MSAPNSVAGSGRLAEAVSPELVLVDPGLAVHAREQLADPDDTLARLGAAVLLEGAPASQANGTGSSFDEATAPAVRRLAQAALAAPASEPLPRRSHRRRRLLAVTAGLFAIIALALFVADLQLEPKVTPTTAETSTLGEPPLVEEAGNTPEQASTTEQAAPNATQSQAGSETPPAPAPRRFAWAPAEGASGYHVELFRGTSRVFAGDTARPEITIPAKWTLGGREYRLEPLEYRWYVWPIVSGRRSSRAIVQARLVVRDR